MNPGKSFSIVTVDHSNLKEHPQTICFINPKNPAYPHKVNWLQKRFNEGMVVKLLYIEGEKRPIGFLEYVPGEFCWRAVNAPGYLFIHCIWINGVKYKKQGFGSLLLKTCVADAQKMGCSGVAALTSSGSFMADRTLFERNEFIISSSDPPYDIMVKQLKKSPLPAFNDWRSQLKKYKGLHIVYSSQCPWVARFVSEIGETSKNLGMELTITELKTSKQAQNAPSPYAVFNLIYNGKLLADHYISETRFLNIIRKELKGNGK